jgi:glycerate-2-kinase
LIIVIVSGGGSALLCSSKEECIQGQKLYEASLKRDQTIIELNTLRKHVSPLKGGGLAKLAYPATVIGLIFSDVPGDHFEDVASGPTYKDETTVADAKKIERNVGNFDFIETPKENKYFEKVHNFVLVSNKTAVEAMAEKSKQMGLGVNILSTNLYDEVDTVLRKLFEAEKEPTLVGEVVLAAGEPRLEVTKKGGSGGRSLFMGLRAVKMKIVDDSSVLLPLASDGMDNSDAAGAVIDKSTMEKFKELKLDVDDYLDRFDAYPAFQKSGDMIMTGATGANVSDLMILLTRNGK